MRSALGPVSLVLMVYVGWVLFSLGEGHNIRDFANVGSRAASSRAVPAIYNDARYSFSPGGYDGQYFLALARAPTRAAPYLDFPQYRYSRIGYPLAARGLALGRQEAIPYALVAVNLLAVTLTTLVLAFWLTRLGVSPWFSLLYAFFPGTFVTVQRDLSEPLAYFLAALALLVFDKSRVGRVVLSAFIFGLAALTRESAALLALGCAFALLLPEGSWSSSRRRRMLSSALFLVAALGPYLVYRAFLWRWLGGATSTSVPPSRIPFETIASYWPWSGDSISYVYSVIAPSLLVGAVAVWAIVRGARAFELVSLLAAIVVFVVFAPSFAYADPAGALRSIVAVALMTVFVVPELDKRTVGRRNWLWLAAIAWFAPWWQLLPFAFNRSWS